MFDNDGITKAVTSGLEKFYGIEVNSNTSILDFTNSSCHNYKKEYIQEFENRRRIAPSDVLLSEKWRQVIEKRNLVLSEKSDRQKYSVGNLPDRVRIIAFCAIQEGSNITISSVFFSALPYYQTDISSFDEKPSSYYQDYLSELDFRAIAVGVIDAYFLQDLSRGKTTLSALPGAKWIPVPMESIETRSQKVIALSQELYTTAEYFGCFKSFDEELLAKCTQLAENGTNLLSFIEEFDFLKSYDPRSELINSFNYKSGLELLINKLEELVEYDLDSEKPKDFWDMPSYYNSKIRYKEGYFAGIKGEHLHFSPIYYDYGKKYERQINFFVYELVHGALIAFHLPKLRSELEKLNKTYLTDTILNSKSQPHNHPYESLSVFLKANYGEEFGIDTTIIDFTRSCGRFERFEIEYSERKSITSDWEQTLSKWIEDIESISVQVGFPHTNISSYKNYISSLVRSLVTHRKDLTFKDLAGIVSLSENLIEPFFEIAHFDAVMDGAVYSLKLPNLKRELALIKKILLQIQQKRSQSK